jgi:diguanylate cyclase (GGDEF)-like protein
LYQLKISPQAGEGTDLMRIYDRDFRYLLLHLVPQHRLPADLRRDVDQALRTGGARDLREASVRALEALCDTRYFERADVHNDNGNVVVGYRRVGASYQVSVAIPSGEWDRIVAPGRGGEAEGVPPPAEAGVDEVASAPPLPPAAPAAPVVTAAPPLGTVSTGATELLPDIARSFAITDRSAPVLERLDVLLGTLERWLGLTASRLDVLEDTLVIGGGEASERVRVVSDEELRASELVRRAIESGARRLVEVADLDAASAEGVSGGVVGVAPIFALGKVVGALRAVFAPTVDRSALDARLDAASAVVRHVIEFHHQFESLTSIDSLTGVYNRQFYDHQMPVEIERAMRSGSALSMLVLDIDDFKRVNDEMGHKKGDEALVAVADIIRRNLRKVDMPFRYGGEEIVILLPGTPEFEALHTAERLRRVIQQHRGFRDPHGATRELTVSVGVAVYPDTARSADQLFAQADEAMYRAKQRGKNQVVLYSTA